MNLNQFKYLLEIHRQGSITKAARELYVATPSVSNAMKELEQELGYTLMTRTHSGVVFTEQGEKAVLLVQEIERNIEALKMISHTSDALFGRLTISGTFHFSSAFLLDAILQIKNENPKLDVILQGGDSPGVIKLVAQNEADIGIIMISSADQDFFRRELKRNHLQFNPLFQDTLCFVMQKKHPLAQQDAISMADAFYYPYYTHGGALNESLLEMIHQYNPDAAIFHINDRDSLRRTLAHTEGITLMPLSIQDIIMNQFPDLVFLPIKDYRFNCSVGWIHNSNTLSSAELKFIQLLQKISLQFIHA